MIIAFAGKKRSGKDTAGSIAQVLLSFPNADNETVIKYLSSPMDNPDWKIKKFASYLKSITAQLTGCTIQDLEIEEKKNEVIYEKWKFTNSFLDITQEFEHQGDGIELYQSSKKLYLTEHVYSIGQINNNITYKPVQITRRDILQRIGTDVARNIHSSIWIDHMFSDYREKKHYDTVVHRFDDAVKTDFIPFKYQIPENPAIPKKHWGKLIDSKEYEFNENVINYRMPKWIITDTRFPNEADAVKKRKGLLIRINRPSFNGINITKEQVEIACSQVFKVEHISETALDDYNRFDYVIDNTGTIEELIDKIRTILTTNKLI